VDNFTPLKTEKKKRKVSKFFIFGNLLLVIIVALIGFFYYNQQKLISRVPKAGTGCNADHPKWECVQDGCCWQGADDGCTDPNAGGTQCTPAPGSGQCNDCTQNRPSCPDGQTLICNPDSKSCVTPVNCLFPTKPAIPLESCGGSIIKFQCYTDCACSSGGTPTPTPTGEVTNTPTPTGGITNTPTPTGIITNTPTPTMTPSSTPTSTPESTPTATPTGTITPSNTPTITPTNTPGPSSTPIPVLCGTKDCDDKTNPCRSGYLCVQAHDGSNYCTSADFANACKANPSYNNCCTAPGAPTATPTEIILAKTTVTVTPAPPVSGISSLWIYIIPILTIIGGILL